MTDANQQPEQAAKKKPILAIPLAILALVFALLVLLDPFGIVSTLRGDVEEEPVVAALPGPKPPISGAEPSPILEHPMDQFIITPKENGSDTVESGPQNTELSGQAASEDMADAGDIAEKEAPLEEVSENNAPAPVPLATAGDDTDPQDDTAQSAAPAQAVASQEKEPLPQVDPSSPIDVPPETAALGDELEPVSPQQEPEEKVGVAITEQTDTDFNTSVPNASSQPNQTGVVSFEAPSFDLVRVDDTGSGIVAGRAAPGSEVRVLSNGSEIASVEANARGEFVAFVQTPSNDEGQSLSLMARRGAEDVAIGEERVFLLPTEDPTQEASGAGSAPAVLRRDPATEAVRVVEPGGLGKAVNVTLDSISYDAEGAVLLAGRAPKAQPIRIYVNGAPVADTNSRTDGTWDVRTSEIAAGRYVLRIDALGADGKVETRVESPFQRVFPTAGETPFARLSSVTVQPGNTLWVMARNKYGDGLQYTQIFAANRDLIRDPDLIYPGQIFSLPELQEQ